MKNTKPIVTSKIYHPNAMAWLVTLSNGRRFVEAANSEPNRRWIGWANAVGRAEQA